MTLAAPQLHQSPQPYRFTRDEYYRMVDVGLFEGRRVELIEGEIIEMAAMKDLHAVATGILERALKPIYPDCWIRQQLPLSLNLASDPEPDFAVVPGEPRSYKGKGHPSSALLVVEISDTSLRYDQIEKASMYAKAGIADYWIVNLVEACLEVRRDPAPNASAMYGFKYKAIQILRVPMAVAPLSRSQAAIQIADLLP